MRLRIGKSIALAVLAVLFISALPGVAFAQPSSFLELDNNIRDGGGTNPPYDWGHSNGSTGTGGVFNAGSFVNSTTVPNPPAVVISDPSVVDAVFIVDPLSSDDNTCGTGDGDSSVYTGAGGEKNGQLLSGMTWATSSVPPKDEISNAYALAHRRDNGGLEIFFGAERVETDGDSHIDFEFFQSNVALTGNCTDGGTFSGNRSQGDLLLAVDFTNGGTLGTTILYQWHCNADPGAQPAIGTVCNPPANGPSVPHYEQIALTEVVFGVNAAGDIPCGGWACREVDGDEASVVPQNGFMEGGIDLTGLGFTGCLSTFLPHTRSSQSFTATLKDFGGPVSFDTCQPPDITTTSNPTGNVAPNTPVTDNVTVGGSLGPAAGTVDFFICTPAQVTGAGCPTGGSKVGATKTLNGSGQATSDPFTNTSGLGKYCWRAEYTPASGSMYRAGTHTNSTTECFTVSRQPSTTVTTSTPTGGNVVPGSPVLDTATVSGDGPTPTGTVTFFLCQPAAVTADGCPAGGDQVGSPVPLNGSGVAISGQTDATTTIGKYCWRAEYSGDGYYLPSSHTNATTECFTTVKQPSNTATTASIEGSSDPAGTNLVPGTSVIDIATVTGSGPTPTGTVTFYLCSPSEVTAGVGCALGDGTLVGSDALDGSGVAVSPPTNLTLAIGTYCWRAEYSGDGFYLPSNHTNDDSECFATVQQLPGLATASVPNAGGVVPGTPVSDIATLTGVGNLPLPTGTVTFYLCGPADVTANGCPSGGTLVGSDAIEAGVAVSPTTDATTAIGTYCWRAEYSGDALYLPTTHSNATTECFTTVQQPSETSTTAVLGGTVLAPEGPLAPGTAIADIAVVTGAIGTPTGTVTFFLCGPAEITDEGCPTGGTEIGSDTLDASGVAISPATDDTLDLGTYCWRAEYSGDESYEPSSHTNADTECFTIELQPSVTTTVSSPTGALVVPIAELPVAVFDTATVTGEGPIPTGTVTFFLCGPAQGAAATEDGCTTGGTQYGDPAALDAAGKATSPTVNVTTAGRYCWRAEYSGDDFYSPSSHTNGTTECMSFTVVLPQPPITRTGTGPTGMDLGFAFLALGIVLVGLSRRGRMPASAPAGAGPIAPSVEVMTYLDRHRRRRRATGPPYRAGP